MSIKGKKELRGIVQQGNGRIDDVDAAGRSRSDGISGFPVCLANEILHGME